mgnify:CR=1 FL=1
MAFAIADVGQLGVYYARMLTIFRCGRKRSDKMDFLQYLKDYGPLFLNGDCFFNSIPDSFI